MSRSGVVKRVLNKIPQIIKYGEANISLQSSVKPEVKATTTSAIKILKQVAFEHKLVSLSANQIGLDERVFVALKSNLMRPGKWSQYHKEFEINNIKNPEAGYEAIISPIQITSSFDEYYCFEECPSFPGLKFKVKIPIYINIKYLTQSSLLRLAQKQNKILNFSNIPEDLFTTQKITGFKGRVWDHQIRHLQGLLPIQEKICNGQFYLQDDYKSQIQNIHYYRDIKRIESNFMEENLKKLGKQQERKAKDKSKEQPSQKQHPNSFEQISETLSKLTGNTSLKGKNMQKPNKNNSKTSNKRSAKNT